MTPLGLEVRHIEMLEVLLTESHVSRAAERLALSQPAVSNALAQMRLHFRDDLLVRDGARMTLTPFAQRLQGQVSDILRAIRALAAARPFFSPAETDHRFRVAMPPHVGALIMPALIRMVAAQAPGARVDCQPLTTAWKSFEAGELDLIVCSHNMLPSGCQMTPVMDDHWRCLLSRSVVLPPGGLSREAWDGLRIVIPDGDLQRTMPDIGREGSANASAPMELIPHVVAEGGAAAVVPASFAQFHQLTLPLQSVALPIATPTIRCVMAWQANLDDDPANLWLREQVLKAAAPANERLAELRVVSAPSPAAAMA